MLKNNRVHLRATEIFSRYLFAIGRTRYNYWNEFDSLCVFAQSPPHLFNAFVVIGPLPSSFVQAIDLAAAAQSSSDQAGSFPQGYNIFLPTYSATASRIKNDRDGEARRRRDGERDRHPVERQLPVSAMGTRSLASKEGNLLLFRAQDPVAYPFEFSYKLAP